MLRHGGRRLLMIAVVAALAPLGGTALGQTQLPEIDVTAPSPIVRRAPARPSAPAPAPDGSSRTGSGHAHARRRAAGHAADRHRSVRHRHGRAERRAAPHGGQHAGRPAVRQARDHRLELRARRSSRPIIRGLDVNRVGIVENGIGGGGVSDLGEDHFVPIDPLATNQVEVIRGPATLRYGSQSIGGVGSSTNNRIPEALPARPWPLPRPVPVKALRPRQRGSVRDLGDARRRAQRQQRPRRRGAARCRRWQFRLPRRLYGHTRRRLPHPELSLSVPSRASRSTASSRIRASGRRRVGRRLLRVPRRLCRRRGVQINALYHIPGDRRAEHQHAHRPARRPRLASKGEYRPHADGIDTIRFWLGATDYKHHELGLADPADPPQHGIRQTFTNKEQEGRARGHADAVRPAVRGAHHRGRRQAGHQELTAPSDDARPVLNGLFGPEPAIRALPATCSTNSSSAT